MDIKKYLFLFVLFFVSTMIWGETIVLTPTVRNPNTFTFSSPTLAGDKLADITNTAQSVKYSGSNQYTTIIKVSITSGTVPSGIKLYLKAAPGAWWEEWLGIGGGNSASEFEVTSSAKNLITGITTTTLITRVLTLSMRIVDFAQLHPTNNPISLTYTISAQ